MATTLMIYFSTVWLFSMKSRRDYHEQTLETEEEIFMKTVESNSIKKSSRFSAGLSRRFASLSTGGSSGTKCVGGSWISAALN